MQNAAQDSQSKSGNLGRGAAVYAFKIARVNPENLSVKFWTLGGSVRRFSVPCSELAALAGQIESAIANGEFYLYLGGVRFDVSEKLLREIRAQLSSYAVLSGGSGAHVVRGGVSTPVKPKAPARAVGGKEASSPSAAASAGCQFNKELAGEVARVVGDELRRAVMPILAEIDAIAALVKECLSELEAASNDFITCAPGDFAGRDMPPAPRRKGGRESYCPKAGRGNAEGSISTRRGRTSVVVSRRKIS